MEDGRLGSFLEGCNILLIGGAPRSGTTLICNLLDSHPEVIVFPFEHRVLEQFFWNGPNEHFFSEEFISNRKFGQQAVLSSDKLLAQYQNRMKSEFGKEFSLKIDHIAFKQGYQDYLAGRDITMRSIFEALIYGLTAASDFVHRKIASVKYIVFKQPFYTELFLEDYFKEDKRVHVIHLMRNPKARYVSAKRRRLSIFSKRKLKLTHINRRNYVLGHCVVDIATRQLASKNQSLIGKKQYMVISFEDLATVSFDVMQKCTEWLGLCQLKDYPLTRLGMPSMTGSLRTNDFKVDASRASSGSEYLDITTKSERTVHSYYLLRYGLEIEGSRISPISALIHHFFPFKYSSTPHYFFQILTTYWAMTFDTTQFINGIRNGSLKISGAV